MNLAGSGLDYPGIQALCSLLHKVGELVVVYIKDNEAAANRTGYYCHARIWPLGPPLGDSSAASPVSLVPRPLYSWLFGAGAERKGREAALVVSQSQIERCQ